MAMDGDDWSFTQALQTPAEGSWLDPPEQQEMMEPPSVEMGPSGILLPTQEDAFFLTDPFLEPSPSQARSIVVEPVATTLGLAHHRRPVPVSGRRLLTADGVES